MLPLIVSGTAASPTFTNLLSGTNASAAMVVGTGASLTVSGSGSITATGLTGTPNIAVGTIGATAITGSGELIVSSAGAASTPAVSITGAPYTGGTGTTTVPLVYLNSGTAPTTWSTAGTILGINTSSGYTGNFVDFHVNGAASVFNVNYQGNTSLGINNTGTITANQGLLNELIVTVLATPVNSAFSTTTTGGSLAPATYWYRVSATDGTGSTVASTQTSQIVPAGTSTNTVSVNWGAIVGATGYNIYGRTTGAELLIASVSGNATTTYTDTGSITPAGALPNANKTGRIIASSGITGNFYAPSITSSVDTTTGLSFQGGNEIDFVLGGSNIWSFIASSLKGTGSIAWTGTIPQGNADNIIYRVSAGVLGLGTTSSGNPNGTLSTNQASLNEVVVTALATPVNAAFATATTGGTLAAGTYYYRVAATDAQGITLASTETSQVVPAGTSTNTVTVNWAQVSGATGYKVYGRSTGAELLMATIAAGNTVTWIDTGSVSPSGALPTINTTGNINSAAAQTTISGTTGTMICTMPFAGSSYKRVVIYLNALVSVGGVSYTYPTAFTYAPAILGSSTNVALATTTTTAVTVTAASAGTGFIELVGF